MSKEDIVLYHECEDEMRQKLEYSFNYYMNKGEKESAHEVLKSLMKYRLVDKDDPRCSTSTKIFGNDVDISDTSNYGAFDYRRNDIGNFIPQYLFKDLKRYTTFYTKVLAHWGKRVEGNYEGDIKVNASSAKMRLENHYNRVTTRRIVEDMDAIARESKMNLGNLDDFCEEVNAGVIRLYKVEVQTPVLISYRYPAYVMLKMNSKGDFVSTLLIKYSSLLETWVDINDFIDNLSNAVKECMGEDIKIINVLKPDAAIKTQLNRSKASSSKDEETKKLIAKQAAEAEAKKSEAKAKKTKSSNKDKAEESKSDK